MKAMKRGLTGSRALWAAVLIMLAPVFLQPGCASSKSGKKEAAEQAGAAEEEGPGSRERAEGAERAAGKAAPAGEEEGAGETAGAAREKEPATAAAESRTPAPRRRAATPPASRGPAYSDETEIKGIASAPWQGYGGTQLVARRATPWEAFYYRVLRVTSARSWKQFFTRGWASTRSLFRKLIPFLDRSPGGPPRHSGAG